IEQDEWKIKLKELKDICWISKPLLVVDVTRYYEKRIRKVFHIVNSMEYTNANSHKMTMMIIDTRK
ncbi:MAG: hypothetical protein LH629_14055, partial [Ignavibacteria bacterium]|nr:hypothetical protein [Ignavibacteria bacterium]